MWEKLTGAPPDNWNTSNVGPNPRVRMPVSTANFADYARASRSLGLAAFEAIAMNLTENGPSERIWGQRISRDYFLGAPNRARSGPRLSS